MTADQLVANSGNWVMPLLCAWSILRKGQSKRGALIWSGILFAWTVMQTAFTIREPHPEGLYQALWAPESGGGFGITTLVFVALAYLLKIRKIAISGSPR